MKAVLGKMVSLIMFACLISSCQPGEMAPAESAGQASQDGAAQRATQSNTAAPASSQKKFPSAVGYVNDFAKVLNDESRAALKSRIEAYEKDTQREVAVVTVKSIEPYSNIHAYATALGNEWGVGKKDKDNGVVLLFCSGCQAVSIAAGSGATSGLTDAVCQAIIDRDMIPKFREGQVGNAMVGGLDGIFRDWPL